MSKHTDEQLLGVSSSCAAYLGEKFVYERGLFQGMPPTQMMIRSLANRMIQGSMGCIREENDPHIVVGVMLYALKSLRFCIFHEAETLLSGIEITEDYRYVCIYICMCFDVYVYACRRGVVRLVVVFSWDKRFILTHNTLNNPTHYIYSNRIYTGA